MSAQGTIKSYWLIIKRISGNQYPTAVELMSYLEEYDFEISKRTFDRYLQAIRDEFDIDIIYDNYKKGYCIKEDPTGSIQKFINFLEMVVSAGVFADSLKDWKKAVSYISFESIGNMKGIEQLNSLLDAVKNKRKISFLHTGFESESSVPYRINPYFLKEYQSRWYVVGVIDGKKELRTFGIDRISDLEVLDTKFKPDANLDPVRKFENVIGLYYSDIEVEEVILSFTPQQGNYVRTLPLHKSQEIITDNKMEFRIKLYVVPNYELKQKILMLGDSVEVIEPVWFRKELIEDIRRALKVYE